MTKRLFISLDFPPDKGGIQNYIFGLVSNMVPRDCRVLTTVGTDYANSLRFDQQHSFLTTRVKFFWPSGVFMKIVHLLRLLITALSMRRGFKYIEVYFGNVYPIGLLGPLFKYLFGVKYIPIIYGMDIQSLRTAKIRYHLIAWVLHSASAVICISSYTKKLLVEMGLEGDRVLIVHPGIDLTQFSQIQQQVDLDEVRKRFGLGGSKILMTVARLVERKGHDVVLQALHEMSLKKVDYRYVICGDGPMMGKLRELVYQYDLDDKVTFTGVISNVDLVALYMCSHVFVMPSREIVETGDVEGFGIVFLEANYFGLPVIAGRSGGIPDAVLDGETGFLVDPEDPVEIGSRMRLLITDDELANRLGQNGKRWVVERCQWPNRVETFDSQVQSVL